MYGNRLTEKKGKDKSFLCVKKAWRYLTNPAIWGKWLELWNRILVSLLWTNYGSLKDIRGFPGDSAGEKSTCSAGDPGLIPGLGRSTGEGKVYPLQYYGLEQSMGCQRVLKTEWLSLTKVTVDSDCSCEVKRHLLLEGKAMTNLDAY